MTQTDAGTTCGVNPPTVGDELNLNLPRKGAKDMFLFRAFNAIDMYHRYVASMDYSKPLRLKTFVRNCVIMIPDEIRRNEILDGYEDACDYVQQYLDVDSVDKTDLLLEVAASVVGSVISYLDEYCGISRTNSLVPLCSLPDPRVQQAVEDILGDASKGEMEPTQTPIGDE